MRADRLKKIPPYLFAEINKKIAAAKAAGIDVISLGIGDPDLPTPRPVIEALYEAAQDPKNHQYPDYEGLALFREEVAKWYKRRHNVSLNSTNEVLTLIGSKEGSLHLSLAMINPGDVALVPEPGYTPYMTSTYFAEGSCHFMPLLEENDFLPDLSAIPRDVARAAKILYLNYPNNPTAAVAEKEFYKESIDFAKDNNVFICSDNPYSEVGLEGYRPLSFLEVPGAKDVGIELNSLSKTYNMTGWRIGMAGGHPDVIKAMADVKSNIDSGVFNAIQHAGIAAMRLPDSHIDALNAIYTKRRDIICEAFSQAGVQVIKPKASFFLWSRCPENYTSAQFATEVLEKAGVVITPGSAYGKTGEGYFRVSFTVPDERLREAVSRIKEKVRV